MPINSGYSFYEYAGDGVTTRFPVQFSLGELKRAYVTCRVDNEVDAFGAPLYRELADVPGDPGMIEVLGAVPGVGVPIVFRRIVPKELLLHLYANGSILDYPSLDESHLQLMMALHEVLDGYGLTNVFTDINMNGYKLTNVFSDPDDPDSIATVAFLGTYRQDALDAAIAAADSALKALGYRDTALGHANTAAAQVVLCQDQVQLAVNQVLIAEGHADAAALSAIAADGFADDAEQSVLDARAAVNSAAFTNLPIGTLVWHTGTTAFPGSIVADGELRSRAAFPDLWAFAQTSGNISVDDASWSFGQYSPGDGSTTFRVPKADDRFIRGKSATRAVGLVEEDVARVVIETQNATYGASIAPDWWISPSRLSPGCVYSPVVLKSQTHGGDETRPKALTMLPCIKAYDVISDPNVLNAVEVVNEISRLESEKLAKTDIVAPGDAPMYACRAWVNFDGTTTPPTIRASGNVSSVVRNATGDFTVNFTTPMEDINYVVDGIVNRTSSYTGGFGVALTGINQLTTSCNIYTISGGTVVNLAHNHIKIFR